MSSTSGRARAPQASRRRGLIAGISRTVTALAGALLLGAGSAAVAAPPVELSGELDVVIKEDFERGRFEHDYFLREDGGPGWYQLEFQRQPPAHWKSGQRLHVRGEPRGRKFLVESLEEGASATVGPLSAGGDAALAATDERRALVLMVDLANAKASSRYTLTQISGQMFTNARSVDGLFREASLGQMSFPPDTDGNGQPDVFGPFTIANDNSNCNYYDWATAAEAAAQAAGINLSLYRHRVFVLPRYNDLPACSWAGVANVGCGSFCRAWIAEGESGMVYAHELGHNGGAAGGMAHAGTDPGNDGTIDNAYGDSSDPMGSSRAWHVFNAGHIDQMGWYAGIPGAVATVVAGGTYDLAAIGLDPATAGAPVMLKIAKPDSGDYYYLSYRQPIGYDASLSSTYTAGVNIHRYKGAGYAYTSHLKTLADGGVFNDAATGITVTQLGRSGSYASVRVDFGCAAAAPTVALSPASRAVKPGTAASFSLSLANGDSGGCGSTTFALAPGGAASSVTPASLTLAAGQTGSGSVGSPGSLAEGSYTLSVSASDADGVEPHHAAGSQGSAALIVDGTPPGTPAGLSGSADRRGKVNLSWQAATDALSGVAGYTVYRNGSAVAQPTVNSWTDTATTAGATYSYAVSARDAAGNASAASAPVSVTVAAKSGKR